ncbi:helix-turn-helix domain-containing protein [Tsukamurella sp. USMM236]|uniref:helix-turn-helix domain-containing protein n=1 Tax=Tsukamurella sp. USMM236 TaxID=3081301 RepID=UPI003016E126
MSDLEQVTDRNFAANVKARREAMGLSKAEFVRRLADLGWGSAHQTTLTRIEDSERPARLGEARLMAAALDVPLGTLMQKPEINDLATHLDESEEALKRRSVEFSHAMFAYEIARRDLLEARERAKQAGLPLADEQIGLSESFPGMVVRSVPSRVDRIIDDPKFRGELFAARHAGDEITDEERWLIKLEDRHADT